MIPLTKKHVTTGDKLAYRIEVEADTVPEGQLLLHIVDNTAGRGAFYAKTLPITSKGHHVFTDVIAINRTGELNEYALRFTLTGKGNVVIHKPMVVEGEAIPEKFVDTTDYSGDYTRTRVEQTANSWAVKNLTNSGTVLSQLNLNKDGSVKIDGKLVRITGQTVIDNGVIKSAMIDSLDADKITAGILDASKARLVNVDASSITSGSLSANFVRGGILSSINGLSKFNLQTGQIEINSEGVAIRNQFTGRPIQWLAFGTGIISGVQGAYTALLSNRDGNYTFDGAVAGIQIWNAKSTVKAHSAINLYGHNVDLMPHGRNAPAISFDTNHRTVYGLEDIVIKGASLANILDNIFDNFRNLENNGNYSRGYYNRWR